MKKYLVFAAMYLLPMANSKAQTFTSIENANNTNLGLSHLNLKVGDVLPEVKIYHLLNFDKATTRLSKLRRKLTILDMWNSGCASCINLFPHLQELQEKFGKDLRIILLNAKSKEFGDDAAKILSVLNHSERTNGTKITLPVIYDCPKLDKYFPFQVIPQEVLIDSTGKVIAITFAEDLTEQKIAAVLRDEKVKFKLKSDFSVDLQSQTLFDLGEKNGIKPYFSSLLIRGYLSGHTYAGFKTLDNGEIIKWYTTNQPLLEIFRTAYSNEIGQIPTNRLFAEVKNKQLFTMPKQLSGEAIDSAYFSYEINVQPSTSDELFEYVREDLTRIFHTEVKVERREVPCFILKAAAGNVISSSKGGTPEYLLQHGSLDKSIRNMPINEVVSNLNQYFTKPLIDETGSTANIDLNFRGGTINQESIIAAFEKAGLTVSEEKRLIEVGLITDKKE